MVEIRKLSHYEDAAGNRIVFDGVIDKSFIVDFKGSNNVLTVNANARIGFLKILFDCDNGSVNIGGNSGVSPLKSFIRIGQDSKVVIGENVSCTDIVSISALEGTSVAIGDDVMIASENHIWTDDAHPIFDVTTGQRINFSQSITIGNHVWLARRACVLGGSSIGNGSVLGFGSILKGELPNNCVAVGVPARVVRKDVAWERPHLSLKKPFYKPDSSAVVMSDYWSLTVEGESFQG